jgi:hypothetical protein
MHVLEEGDCSGAVPERSIPAPNAHVYSYVSDVNVQKVQQGKAYVQACDTIAAMADVKSTLPCDRCVDRRPLWQDLTSRKLEFRGNRG